VSVSPNGVLLDCQDQVFLLTLR